jgi:hypothetical protein
MFARRGRIVAGGASLVLVGLAVVVPVPVGASTTWSHVSSPNVGSRYNSLSNVSCVSATTCIAVGEYLDSNDVYRTLIESWNGANWTQLSSANAGYADNSLTGVSCVSATSCIAVGYYIDTSNTSRTLIESWNGANWIQLSSPNSGARDNGLFNVSCLSATSCIAVGEFTNNSYIARTLVESWNGASWTRVASPNAGTNHNLLSDVSCVSPTSCIAVGSYRDWSTKDRTLIESWDGTYWTRLASPNVGTNYNYLNEVSCVSATSCTAVGAYKNTGNVYRTLIVSWNGTSWTSTSSPNAGTDYNALWSVSCVSATSCIAIGFYVNTSDVYQTMIESWNGTNWTRLSSPNVGASHNFLWAVSCVPAAPCTAVGSVG